MQRLFMSLVLVIMLLIAALTAAPLLVNVDGYKSALISTIKASTGLDAEVSGRVEVYFLPTPSVRVTNVTIANVKDASSANIVHVESVRVDSSFKSLLMGNVDIKNLRLSHPIIELERLKGGDNNWQLVKDAFKQRVLPEDFSFPKKIIIENGTLSYRNKGKTTTIDYINSTIVTQSVNGPFDIEGNFSNNANIISFEGNIGELAEGADANFKLSSESFLLELNGNYKGGQESKIIGKVKGDAIDLEAFITVFFDESGTFSKVKSNEKVEISGDFSFSKQIASFSNVKILSESFKGGANIDALFGDKGKEDKIQWDIDIDISAIDFDKLLKEEKEEKSDNEEIDYYATSLKTTKISDFKFDIPQGLLALFKLSIAQITYNNQNVNDLRIDTDIFDGKVIINSFSASLPGNSTLNLTGNVDNNGTRPLLKGQINASGDNLRTVLTWLSDKNSFIPEDELGKYLFTCDIHMTPQRIGISNIYMAADKTLLTGDITTRPASTTPSVKADIQIDRLNFDQYKFTEKIDQLVRNFASNISQKNLEGSWLRIFNLKFDLSLDAKDLTYNGFDVKHVLASLALSKGVFNLQRVIFSSKPVSLTARTYINLLKDKPIINTIVKAKNFDTGFFIINKEKQEQKAWQWSDKPFDFLGIDRFHGNTQLSFKELKHKSLTLKNLNIEGDLKQKIFTLSKANTQLYGGKAAIKGSIGVSQSSPSLGVSMVMSNVDLQPLIKIFDDNNNTTGKAFFSGTIKASGNSPLKLISKMNIEGKAVGRNVVVNNLDLNSIVKNSRTLYSVIDMDTVVKKAMQEGQTTFTAIEGKVKTSRGVLSATDFKIATKATRGVFAGNASLVNFKLNGIAKLSFRPERQKRVALGINLKGDLANIEKTIDTSQLENYITEKGSR